MTNGFNPPKIKSPIIISYLMAVTSLILATC